ncbi:hypothetical protein MKEN_00877200 [Mycena kentingensis (nom. inval.)]|nr:hypothetical protein MKEN_00877200 [Mycena kentingensis (nom. inval.)]
MLSFASPSWQTSFVAKTTGNNGFLGSGQTRVASLIVPQLYLSDYWTAHDEKDILRLKVTHVVSVIDREPTLPDCIPAERRLRISITDRASANISEHLSQATEFISAAINESDKNCVLVHCFQGVSRSATVVCAYLVASTTMSSGEAIAFVQSKRAVVNPNPGFRRQLRQWAVDNHGEAPEKTGRVAKFAGGFAQTFREMKAIAGAQPVAPQPIPKRPASEA